VCSSGYAATDTSWKKDAANSSALTVTQKEAEPQKNSIVVIQHMRWDGLSVLWRGFLHHVAALCRAVVSSIHGSCGSGSCCSSQAKRE
jgi:hypothetical protein